MRRQIFSVLTALGLTLIGAFMVSSEAVAQQAGSLVMGVYQCPDGYNGEAYAADCTEPAVGVEFTLGTPNLDNTEKTASRGDGLATFSLAPFNLDPSGSDQLILGEPATQTGDYAVSCTDNGAALDLKDETTDSLRAVTFAAGPGNDIGCNWYRIQRPMLGARTQQPTDAGGESTTPVTAMPSTGSGTTAQQATNPMSIFTPALALLLLTGVWIYDLRRGR